MADSRVDQLTAATRADMALKNGLAYLARGGTSFADRKLSLGLLSQIMRGVDVKVGVACVKTWYANDGTGAQINQGYGMAYSPELGIMVSVGAGGAMWSGDGGRTWNAASVPNANDHRGVCWAGGTIQKFISVGRAGTGNRVNTSTDGKTWTAGTSAGDYDWRNVCYSPQLDLLVAVSETTTNTGTLIATSPDGTNWTLQTAATAKAICAIVWMPERSQFVAMCGSVAGSLTTQTSPDGVNWTAYTAYTGTVARGDNSLVYSPELDLLVYCANTTTTSCIWSSADGGQTFTVRTAPSAGNAAGVNWSPELGVFVISVSSATPSVIWYSTDGTTWVASPSFTFNNARAVGYCPDTMTFSIGSTSHPIIANSLPPGAVRIAEQIDAGLINTSWLTARSLSLASAAGSGPAPVGPVIGTATLVAGTVTVTTPAATTTCKIFLSTKTAGGTIGTLTYTVSAGASFTINSANVLDTSTIDWMIVEAFTPT